MMTFHAQTRAQFVSYINPMDFLQLSTLKQWRRDISPLKYETTGVSLTDQYHITSVHIRCFIIIKKSIILGPYLGLRGLFYGFKKYVIKVCQSRWENNSFTHRIQVYHQGGDTTILPRRERCQTIIFYLKVYIP